MSPSVALAELEERAGELVPIDAIRGLVDTIYALDVDDWTDEALTLLESIIDTAIQAAGTLPSPHRRVIVDRLLIAREGVEQGMAPDPDKRPSLEQVRTFVSARLA